MRVLLAIKPDEGQLKVIKRKISQVNYALIDRNIDIIADTLSHKGRFFKKDHASFIGYLNSFFYSLPPWEECESNIYQGIALDQFAGVTAYEIRYTPITEKEDFLDFGGQIDKTNRFGMPLEPGEKCFRYVPRFLSTHFTNMFYPLHFVKKEDVQNLLINN